MMKLNRLLLCITLISPYILYAPKAQRVQKKITLQNQLATYVDNVKKDHNYINPDSMSTILNAAFEFQPPAISSGNRQVNGGYTAKQWKNLEIGKNIHDYLGINFNAITSTKQIGDKSSPKTLIGRISDIITATEAQSTINKTGNQWVNPQKIQTTLTAFQDDEFQSLITDRLRNNLNDRILNNLFCSGQSNQNDLTEALREINKLLKFRKGQFPTLKTKNTTKRTPKETENAFVVNYNKFLLAGGTEELYNGTIKKEGIDLSPSSITEAEEDTLLSSISKINEKKSIIKYTTPKIEDLIKPLANRERFDRFLETIGMMSFALMSMPQKKEIALPAGTYRIQTGCTPGRISHLVGSIGTDAHFTTPALTGATSSDTDGTLALLEGDLGNRHIDATSLAQYTRFLGIIASTGPESILIVRDGTMFKALHKETNQMIAYVSSQAVAQLARLTRKSSTDVAETTGDAVRAVQELAMSVTQPSIDYSALHKEKGNLNQVLYVQPDIANLITMLSAGVIIAMQEAHEAARRLSKKTDSMVVTVDLEKAASTLTLTDRTQLRRLADLMLAASKDPAMCLEATEILNQIESKAITDASGIIEIKRDLSSMLAEIKEKQLTANEMQLQLQTAAMALRAIAQVEPLNVAYSPATGRFSLWVGKASKPSLETSEKVSPEMAQLAVNSTWPREVGKIASNDKRATGTFHNVFGTPFRESSLATLLLFGAQKYAEYNFMQTPSPAAGSK